MRQGDGSLVTSPGGQGETSGLTSSDLRTTVTAPAAPQLESTVYQMAGNTATSKEISQQLEIGGSAGDTFVLAGWAKGDSVPLKVWLHGATEWDKGTVLLSHFRLTLRKQCDKGTVLLSHFRLTLRKQ